MPKAKAKNKQDKHPTYCEMIFVALTNLKEVRGSSKESIQKYVYANYPIEESKNTNRYFENALKIGIKNGSIIRSKGTGRNEMFKAGEIKTKSLNKELPKNKGSLRKKAGKGYKTDRPQKTVSNQNDMQQETETGSLKSDAPKHSKEDDVQKPSVCLSDITTKQLHSTYVKIPEDKFDCEPLGIDVTPDGRIIVADRLNGNVKMFGQDGLFLTSYIVSRELDYFFIAVMNDEELIINLAAEKKLLIMTLNFKEMSIRRTIDLKEHMAFISSYQDKIVALSFSGRQVSLLDTEGNILWSTTFNDGVDKSFCKSSYHAVFSTCFLENGRLAVVITDTCYSKIIKLDGETGNILKKCDLPGQYPFGITTDYQGILYVCNRVSREIYAWTTDLERKIPLITYKDCLYERPRTIKYNPTQCELLISNRSQKNFIQHYRVSYM